MTPGPAETPMPIPIICPCSARIKAGDHLQGKHVKCPKCGGSLAVGGANGVHGAAPVIAAKAEAPLPTTVQVLRDSGLEAEERERLEAELDIGEGLLWA